MAPMDERDIDGIRRALFDIRRDVRAFCSCWRKMDKKTRKQKIYEAIRAEQARYDETTRLLEERIAHYDAKLGLQRRRESS